MQTLKINNLDLKAVAGSTERICYLLYPAAITDQWIEHAAALYGVSIAVITGMDWNNDLTPWKAKGVPTGTPDFKGDAAQFLSLLRQSVIPEVEQRLGIAADVRRTLAGVSLSGLFTLWQWMECDVFTDIISLSGSFWYEGFADWLTSQPVPSRSGRAYFLLGDKEAQSPVPQFRCVQKDTVRIVDYLSAHSVKTCFELVPGNHYQYAQQRLERSFAWMFGVPQ